MRGRRGKRLRQLLDDVTEKGRRKLKSEALDDTVWRTGCGSGYGHIVRWTRK